MVIAHVSINCKSVNIYLASLTSLRLLQKTFKFYYSGYSEFESLDIAIFRDLKFNKLDS